MKNLLFILIVSCSIGTIKGQSKLKPLSDEEIMYPDKINGTLKVWSTKDKKSFLTDCNLKTKDILSNNKEYCECTIINIMKGVNYVRYKKLSEFQKGKLTSMHGKVNCDPINK